MLKELPLVSITLLTYNHEKYVKDCLISILEQDYENIEVIILDDASNDKTVAIIEFYLLSLKEKFRRVIFYKNKKNSGNIPFNMNCLMRAAKGVYCKILSGDDILEYNCVTRLINVLLKNKECSVAYSNAYIVQDGYRRNEWIDKTQNKYLYRRSEIESEDFFRKLMFGNRIVAPTVMIKRDVLKKYGLFDETIFYEDYEYWLRISLHREKFYFINECLVYYRRAVSSISNFEDGERAKKIEIGMMSDKKTLCKYLKYLSVKDREKCKEMFYKRYLRMCWKAKYWRGFLKITEKLKKNKFSFPKDIFIEPSNTYYKEVAEKNKMVIKMLERWISNIQEGKMLISFFRDRDIKVIGIYGLGCLASRLCDEIANTEIEIKYIVDKRADMILSDLKLVSMDEDLEEVDAIIVTPAGEYCIIKEQLKEKVSCPIIYIGDILFS